MTAPGLVALEVVESQNRAQVDLLGPRIEVVAHAVPVAQFIAVGRRILLRIEASGLLVQEEDVAVRRAAGRGSRSDVVGDERPAGVESGRLGGLNTWLNPVKDGSQDTPGGERGIDIQTDDQVGLGNIQALEGELRGGLGVCGGFVSQSLHGACYDGLTGARNVVARLDVLVLADSQAQNLGLVILDERQSRTDMLIGRHVERGCGGKKWKVQEMRGNGDVKSQKR